MFRKNSLLVNSIFGALVVIGGLYIMHKYNIHNGRALWPILLPIILILDRLKLLRLRMIITKREVVEILLLLYTIVIFYAFFSNLDKYEDYTFYATLVALLEIYFYPLFFLIILGVIFIGLLLIKDKIFGTKAKEAYDFEMAALFIYQRLGDEVVKKITEENIANILRIKHRFSKDIAESEIIYTIQKKHYDKLTVGEMAEIFRLEKDYIKELEFTFVNKTR